MSNKLTDTQLVQEIRRVLEVEQFDGDAIRRVRELVDDAPAINRAAEISEHARMLETWLALWAVRNDTAKWETTPDVARTAGAEAVTKIDQALRALHDLRSELVTEIRQFDDDSAARADALLERLRGETGSSRWIDSGSGPGWSPDDRAAGNDVHDPRD